MRDSVDKPRTYGNAPRDLQEPLARHIKHLPNWVVWKWFRKPNGKWTKVPYKATTPRKEAKTNDPSTWRGHEQACITVEKRLADGIGFNLLGTNIGAADIDGCRDPDTGMIHPMALDLVRRFNSYTEVTPSGKGLRIVGTASQRKLTMTPRQIKDSPVTVELYRNYARYITISNLPLDGVTTELNDIDALLDTVAAELEPVAAELKPDSKPATDDPFTTHGESIRPDSPWRNLNDAALADLPAWVLALFPNHKLKRRDDGSYRISSDMLGRDLEEDLAITPNGIKDFGVHDMGDEREGKRTPIDLVMEHGGKDLNEAAAWLRERLGLNYTATADASNVPPDAAASKAKGGVTLDSFVAYMPVHGYIFIPTRELWPGSSVNSRIKPIALCGPDGKPLLDKKGEPKFISASAWLDKHRPVEQMTWVPGLDMKIRDRLVADGGWFEHKGVTCFNLYLPPTIVLGDANDVAPWLEHVHKVYPTDADHILNWLAQRKQRPEEKINHALVLGGLQGIGKDTILEPVKRAIGPWNFVEITPSAVTGRFNGFLKSVILRVNEARDLGEVNRFQFYEHMKPYTAAPPDVNRVDEKNLREHSVFNVRGVIITTNYKTDGIYLPADDRRHHVSWSDLTKEDFTEDYWTKLYSWYDNGGDRNVAAYLATRDIKLFDPKAPPPKTEAFWAIVNANRAPEESELADILDKLGNPNAVTVAQVAYAALGTDLYDWITDRKNRKAIPHRLENCGYVAVRNVDAKDELWKIAGKRHVVYATNELTPADQIKAVQELQEKESNTEAARDPFTEAAEVIIVDRQTRRSKGKKRS